MKHHKIPQSSPCTMFTTLEFSGSALQWITTIHFCNKYPFCIFYTYHGKKHKYIVVLSEWVLSEFYVSDIGKKCFGIMYKRRELQETSMLFFGGTILAHNFAYLMANTYYVTESDYHVCWFFFYWAIINFMSNQPFFSLDFLVELFLAAAKSNSVQDGLQNW